MKRIWKLGAIAVALLGFAAHANAAPITGELNITGSVDVSATTIDWVPPNDGGFGTFTTKLPGTGYFSNIVGAPATPVTGDSLDLTLGASGGGFTHVDIGDTNVPNFLYNFSLAQYSGLTFDLTKVVDPSLGSVAQCTGTETGVGTSCYLGVFLLTVAANGGTAISMAVEGYFEDSNIADSRSFYVGQYTTQLGLTIAQIFNILENGGQDAACLGSEGPGVVCASYSANFQARAIPEPATLLTLGTGSAIFAAIRRRRAAKAAITA